MSSRPEPTALQRAIDEFNGQDLREHLYQIECDAFEAAKVSGALRAVACLTRAWQGDERAAVEMTQRNDLADLLEVLSGQLDGQLDGIGRRASGLQLAQLKQ